MDPIIVENIAVNEKREKIEKEIAFLNEILELYKKSNSNPKSLWQGEGADGIETNEYHYRTEIIIAIQKYNSLNEFNNQINKFEEIPPRITFLKNELRNLPEPVIIHPLTNTNRPSGDIFLRPGDRGYVDWPSGNIFADPGKEGNDDRPGDIFAKPNK